jgi:hypothetical protein
MGYRCGHDVDYREFLVADCIGNLSRAVNFKGSKSAKSCHSSVSGFFYLLQIPVGLFAAMSYSNENLGLVKPA